MDSKWPAGRCSHLSRGAFFADVAVCSTVPQPQAPRPAAPPVHHADLPSLLDESMQDAVRWLRRAGAGTLPFEPAFHDVVATACDGPVVAIDGSHVVLADPGPVWVVAYRAAATAWPGTELPVPATVAAASPEEAGQVVDDEYARRGLEAPRVRSAEAFAEALRAVAELDATLQAIDTGPALVLVDGALENLARPARPTADRIVEAAARRDVALVGVAKRSRLAVGGVPLVPVLARQGPRTAWRVPVPEYVAAQVARLHGASRFCFRIDAYAGGDLEAEGIFAALAATARDAVYLGYPYPLAAAHNRVAITGTEAAQLRARLLDAAHAEAGPGAAWLQDFHAVLDDNIA